MVEPINLNKVRKTKAQAEARAIAAANRIRFGRPQSERRLMRSEADKAARELDGKKRD